MKFDSSWFKLMSRYLWLRYFIYFCKLYIIEDFYHKYNLINNISDYWTITKIKIVKRIFYKMKEKIF